MPEQLSPRALCSLNDVKVYGGFDLDDQGLDALLIRLINAASAAIYGVAGREFKPVGINPQTRTFDVPIRWGFDGLEREIYVGDLANWTSVSIGGAAVSSSNVVGLPRVREEWEPITKLRFSGLVRWCSPALYGSQHAPVAITADWGFPLVPEDIRQGCVVTVMVWGERDIRHFSETFSLEEQRVELPRTLPRQVYDSCLNYRRQPRP
jgi:hypothetical protein